MLWQIYWEVQQKIPNLKLKLRIPEESSTTQIDDPLAQALGDTNTAETNQTQPSVPNTSGAETLVTTDASSTSSGDPLADALANPSPSNGHLPSIWMIR